jgi:hypothetical protein
MILKRLMMMPRFCFSEAAQSIEGNTPFIKDINLQLSLIHLQADMLDHFSLLLPKVTLCRQLPKT